MSERSGIEIDYGPKCRSVWLDRGVLDKIIERSMTMPAMPAAPAPQQYETYRDQERPRERSYDDRNYHKK